MTNAAASRFDAADEAPLPCLRIVPGIKRRLGFGRGGDRMHEPNGDVVPLFPVLDIRLVGHRGPRHLGMRRRHTLRHGAPHPPQGLGRTGIHHALGRAFHVRSSNGTAGAGCLHQVEIDVELARERANRGKYLERASACGLRAGLARGGALFAAVDLADDGPGILLLTFRELD